MLQLHVQGVTVSDTSCDFARWVSNNAGDLFTSIQ